MFIALAAAAAALPVPVQELTALHPSTATIVLDVPDIQAVLHKYSTTAPAKMLSDPDLHASIGQMMPGSGGEPVDPWALMMGEYEAAVENGDSPPLLDYLYGMKSMGLSVDVAGSDMMAFLSGMQSVDDTGFYLSQNLGLRLVVDFVDEAVAEQVTQFLVGTINEEGPGSLELSAKAMTVPESAMGFGSTAIRAWSFVPSKAGSNELPLDSLEGSLHIVAGGTRLGISAGNVELNRFVNALSSGSMENAATSLFTAGRATFEKAPETPVFELYMRPFVEAWLTAQEPDALPLLDIAEVLIGPAASLTIRGGHWRTGIDGNGQFITEGLHDPSKGGPMSGVMGTKPLDPSALTLAHPSALVTAVTSLDSMVLAKLVRDLVNREDPDMLSDIEENYGFSLDRDLVESLGSAVSYSLPPLTSLFSAPNLMGAALLNDQDGFTNGMDGLARVVAQYGGDDIQLVRHEYKGVMMYTLSFTGDLNLPFDGLPFDPASFFKPTVTVTDGRVLLTTLPTHAKKEIRRVRKLNKGGDAPGVHAMISAMGDLNGATAVGYADWPAFLGAFYSQVKGIAPLFAGAFVDQLPFDISVLPEAAVMTRHFLPSEDWTRMKGGKVMHYAKSNLGLEAALMPLVGASLYGVAADPSGSTPLAVPADPLSWEEGGDPDAVDVIEESVPDIEEMQPNSMLRASTEASLRQVDVAITLYQIDHKNAAPTALADLLTKTANYPSGYLDGKELPLDGWKRALVYSITEEGYQLYSMGPDGKDNGGGGDDVRSQ